MYKPLDLASKDKMERLYDAPGRDGLQIKPVKRRLLGIRFNVFKKC
jgi:hypothetical protein